ncbi:uncharacterized protein LOC122650228 [Telopea speciosissima]|uniref:uncharacterized protein LOC122650228 n=1 Tax=Telopea speciosissima TaxID=54955 RepID=UPI001CC57893|nr:uncharacterized protein LOC122650228 [Telopea speciosissima]XP_043699509.1 uncharacterized protein LOC122650228 [Telopea speciosissima]
MLQSLHFLSHNFFSALSPPFYPSLNTISYSSSCSYRGTSVSPDRNHLRTRTGPLHAQLSEPTTVTTETSPEDGPIELDPSSSSSSIFATTDNPSTLQVATSVLLTGAISVFLFRAVRRRAKRAKELRLRSSGVPKRTLKDEALDSLKAMKPTSGEAGSPPSPAQALLGALTAGVIALVLYKFTTTIEAALNRQTISDVFTVRQITIAIRTIVNGLCYLATFIFAFNSIGLFLYSGQLAINSSVEGRSEATVDKNLPNSKQSLSNELPVENDKSSSGEVEQASDET